MDLNQIKELSCGTAGLHAFQVDKRLSLVHHATQIAPVNHTRQRTEEYLYVA